MKKKIILYCLLILAFSLFVRPSLGQTKLEAYYSQYETYQKSFTDFKLARDNFLKHKILSARESAIQATQTMLLQRNETLKKYFLGLKDKVGSTPGVISGQDETSLTSLLDKEVLWLDEQSSELQALSQPSLEDLFVLSDRVEDKENDFSGLGYQALAEIILGKVRTLQSESVALTSQVKAEIKESQPSTEAATLNLWVKEVEVKNYLARKEIEAAEINLWNIKSSPAGAKSHFVNLKIDVEDARLYLNQAVSYQKEILNAL